MTVESELGSLQMAHNTDFAVGEAIQVCIRPEDIHLSVAPPQVDHPNHFLASVHLKVFLGEVYDFQVKLGEKIILARVHPSQNTPVGAGIHVILDPAHCIALKIQAGDSAADSH
jgi:iron(III) transport system ATP-binding protein